MIGLLRFHREVGLLLSLENTHIYDLYLPCQESGVTQSILALEEKSNKVFTIQAQKGRVVAHCKILAYITRHVRTRELARVIVHFKLSISLMFYS